MDFINIIALCLVISVISVMLKQYLPEFSLIIVMTTGVLILVYIFSEISPIISQLQSITTQYVPDSVEYIEIIIKSLGIAAISQIASDICTDSGQTALASKIEFVSKVWIVVVAFPLFLDVFTLAITLIEG